MRIDGYTKVLLTVIALALTVIAVRPMLSPAPSYAAKMQYKVLSSAPGMREFETDLNALGRQGWDFAGAVGTIGIMKQ